MKGKHTRWMDSGRPSERKNRRYSGGFDSQEVAKKMANHFLTTEFTEKEQGNLSALRVLRGENKWKAHEISHSRFSRLMRNLPIADRQIGFDP